MPVFGMVFVHNTSSSLILLTQLLWPQHTNMKLNINSFINPLNAELNPICHLLALLGAHHILHFSRIRVNILCFNIDFKLLFKTYNILCL